MRRSSKFKIIGTYLEQLTLITYFFGAGFANAPGLDRKKRINFYLLVPAISVYLYQRFYTVFCGRKTYEGESLVRVLKFISSNSFFGLLLTLSLQFDGNIKWSWNLVTFPIWIFFAILITVGLVSGSTLVTTLCPILGCRSKDWSRLISYLWFNLNVFTLIIMMPMTQMQAVKLLDADDRNSADELRMLRILLAFDIAVMVNFLYSIVFFKIIRYALVKQTSLHEHAGGAQRDWRGLPQASKHPEDQPSFSFDQWQTSAESSCPKTQSVH
jgi:hypothetical protein